MTRSLLIFFSSLALLNCQAFAAEDLPNMGFLQSAKEAHSLTYHCQLDTETSLLNCEFTQTTVRKKGNPEDLGTKLTKAREEFRGGTNLSLEDCAILHDTVEALEGRRKSAMEERWKDLSVIQKKDFLVLIKAYSDFCRSKTEEDYLKITTVIHGKEMRTCLASSNVFKQTFTQVRDLLSESGSWVTQGVPEGPCGIVQLCRLEPERSKDSKSIFWKYIARKAITNPQGSFYPGLSCKDLDEGEYLYDWKSKEISLGCDYIEFSVL